MEADLYSAVLYKLILFAVLMAVVPIGTYFGSLKYIWEGTCSHRRRLLLTVIPGGLRYKSISDSFRLNHLLGHLCRCSRQYRPGRIRRCRLPGRSGV